MGLLWAIQSVIHSDVEMWHVPLVFEVFYCDLREEQMVQSARQSSGPHALACS